jgi:hypothetical protein
MAEDECCYGIVMGADKMSAIEIQGNKIGRLSWGNIKDD